MRAMTGGRKRLCAEMVSRPEYRGRTRRFIEIDSDGSPLNSKEVHHVLALVKDELARSVVSETHAAGARHLQLHDLGTK